LTILAAVFLPLSFVTSLFGMNMNTMTPEGNRGFSDWTNTTIQGLDVSVKNQTSALLSTLETSGTRLWTWTEFGIVSACLVTTLPLSLTLGAILRLSVHYITRYLAYWRALAIIPSSMFIVLSAFGYLPYAFNRHCHYYDLNYPYSLTRYKCEAFSRLSLAAVAADGLLILFEIFMVVRSWRSKRHRAFWSLILLFTVCCFIVTWTTNLVGLGARFPYMALPWIWFGLRWAIPWWRKRRSSGQSTPQEQQH
jgi:hypothetical protein